MRSRTRAALALAGIAALVALAPAIAQRAPESILPPGFGEPAPSPSPGPAPAMPRPAAPAADTVSNLALQLPDNAVDETPADDEAANASDNAMGAAPQVDLPPEARRPLDRVGLLVPADGGMGDAAFGAEDGRFLTTLMRRIDAPIASRWASILLRRALLSQSATPAAVDGADWVAERAWLLVRMGEADNARALVARVDSDNFTPWLDDVAMQAALATADPAALCGIADDVPGNAPAWLLARAMCAGLSGEGGTAAALAGQARDTRRAGGIDVLLAEKVAGAGAATRRAITIQWDGVDTLNAWRFGLASATGVAVPEALYATVGPQVLAWQARAPLLPPASRLFAADRAATLGVFSGAALVDLYGQAYDDLDVTDRSGTPGALLRAAYAGDNAARLTALRALWGAGAGNPYRLYARRILTARAAAMVDVDPSLDPADRDALIASMLSAGLDLQALRWAGPAASDGGSLGWALLAVAAPRPRFGVSAAAIESFAGIDAQRGRLFFAALAGLGRLAPDAVADTGRALGARLDGVTSWTRALDRAVAAREPGTVALLCAAGLQTRSWASVPPAQLYRIVDSLRRVGFEPEARMIAAEALSRS